MILEPKFVDYGSIHSTSSEVPQQHNEQYNLHGTKVNSHPRAVVLPLTDDKNTPNTSTKTKMEQGKLDIPTSSSILVS